MSEYENQDEVEDSTELIFDQLDANKIGKIYFDDLNKLYEFGDVKLKYIVRKMKHEAKVDRSNGKIMIDKKAFIEKFPSIHAASTNLDVDSKVAEEIFEAMTKGTDGATGIGSEDLYKGAFNEFLSSTEVTFVVKEFRKVVGAKRLNNLVIPKQIFVDHYPRIIVELFSSDTITKERGVDITFSDMTLSVKASGLSERKKVVNNVTGRIQEATMNALMGGSGAGKSSLLNALCGRAHYGRVTGEIKINGHEAQIKDHKHLVGFVPQDDIVFAELTVRENLLYAGRFRLPENTTEEEIEDLANETIFSLGLSKVQDSIVGDVKIRGLSGGEKKRVNIGLELMARPRILFLDEPTSGLDSSSSSLVMQSLKKLVDDENMTIVSVIHQPRKFIFDLFDNVILLGAGGKMIYHGSPSDVLHYFTSAGYKLTPGENIADWMMDISTGHLKPASFASLDKQRSSMVLMGNFRGSLIVQNLNSFTEDTESARLKQDIEARNKLFRRWSYYFETLPEEVRKLQFSAPDPAYEIPPAFRKKNFFSQLIFQSQRNLKLSYRKRREKMFDFIILTIATIILCIVNGTANFVYHSFLEGNPPTVPLSFIISKDLNDLPLDSMFFPYEAQALKSYGDGLRLGIIIAGLVSILATKFLSDKRLEFFREASSGYNVNAYYLALNITSTLEISVAMVMIGMCANAIRNTPSNWYASTLNFVMVSWISSGWGLLFSVMMSPGNLVLFTTFFVTISGFLLSGAAPPVQYETIYSNNVVAVISGLFSPLRFFIETMVVSDFKCLEEQTGFTTQDGSSLPLENRSFHKLALGRLDTSIEQFTCDGWYWGILPALLVGVNIRFFGLIMLHTCNRSKQSLQPIRKRLRKPKFFAKMILALVCQSIVTALTVLSFTLPR